MPVKWILSRGVEKREFFAYHKERYGGSEGRGEGVHDGEVTGVTSGVTSELHVTFVTCNSLVTHL